MNNLIDSNYISLDYPYKIIMGRRGRYRGRVGTGGGGGASDMANAVALETTTDIFLTVSPPPSIINGLYSFTGN